jgi:hypothetical protein
VNRDYPSAVSFMPVVFHVQLGRFRRVMRRMLRVSVSRMCVMSRRFVIARFVMLCRLAVMLCCAVVVLCRFVMMLRRFLRHGCLLAIQNPYYRSDTNLSVLHPCESKMNARHTC